MTTKQENLSTVGNIGNALLLVATSVITTCMILQLPSRESFDDNWLRNGFCVSNEDTKIWNSHTLSFFADVILAAVLGYLYFIQPEVPPLQKALLSGGITGVIGHGIGHLHLGMDPTGMDLRFHRDALLFSLQVTAVNIFGFGTIFKGAMPLASNRQLIASAMIASLGFTIFDIEPKQNFIYAQAVIYIFTAIHMLFMPKEHKDTASYALYPYFQLPVLAVGVMESTRCQSFLQALGGHAVFDSSIAIGLIMIELLSNFAKPTKSKLS